MFRHVVLFRFRDDAPTARIDAALDAVRALVDAVPTVRALDVHTDAGEATDNHQAVVLVSFDDVAGYRTYRDHPAHLQVISEQLRPLIAHRAAIQFAVS
jgi:hypothetical protein